jgi:hypothetical protein
MVRMIGAGVGRSPQDSFVQKNKSLYQITGGSVYIGSWWLSRGKNSERKVVEVQSGVLKFFYFLVYFLCAHIQSTIHIFTIQLEQIHVHVKFLSRLQGGQKCPL